MNEEVGRAECVSTTSDAGGGGGGGGGGEENGKTFSTNLT